MSSRIVRVAVLLDENTSSDATLYEAPKSLFRMVADTGAIPYGIPYVRGQEDEILAGHDCLISPGGRFEFPKTWYIDGGASSAPASERCDFDMKLMQIFLAADKPVLGICSGMQMMAGIAGCKLADETRDQAGKRLVHNGKDCTHDVEIVAGSNLAIIMKVAKTSVNSLHNEAVVDVSQNVTISARAPDGVIEAIELESQRFALGIQWHQERFHEADHPGNALFRALVAAAQV